MLKTILLVSLLAMSNVYLHQKSVSLKQIICHNDVNIYHPNRPGMRSLHFSLFFYGRNTSNTHFYDLI
jgi:hypothetical protein